jgi:hypothetical protein
MGLLLKSDRIERNDSGELMNNLLDSKTLLRLAILVTVPFVITAVIVISAQAAGLTPAAPAEAMGMPEGVDPIPVGMAYIDGQEMYFAHTEASDPDIAELLSNMMDSPVLYVPSLADTPESMLADAYVFTNGIEGMGPLGFQADVFDHSPGSDGYRPLRRVSLVTWADGIEPRLLKSLEEIIAAQEAGEVTIEQPDVVINMPFVKWPAGSR